MEDVAESRGKIVGREERGRGIERRRRHQLVPLFYFRFTVSLRILPSLLPSFLLSFRPRRRMGRVRKRERERYRQSGNRLSLLPGRRASRRKLLFSGRGRDLFWDLFFLLDYSYYFVSTIILRNIVGGGDRRIRSSGKCMK